jgi:hypothetical protein
MCCSERVAIVRDALAVSQPPFRSEGCPSGDSSDDAPARWQETRDRAGRT